MAEWKKVIVSGSNAELNKLVVDTHISASLFSGSFVGDGSGLTGLTSAAITTYTNAADNRVITSVNSTSVNGEANLTFDGTLLDITGNLTVSGTSTLATNFTIATDGGTGDTFITNTARNIKIGDTAGAANNVLIDIDDPNNELKLNAGIVGISGSTVNVATGVDTINLNATTIDIPNVAAGTDNTVVVYNGSTLLTDEIDGRVWGSTLVDAANGVDNRLATFTDSNSLNGEANLTFDGSRLAVTGIVAATGTITGSGAQLSSVPAGTDNTVLIVDNDGNVLRDEIDARVWGSTLIDGTLTATRIPYASDANTVTDSGNLTFDGSRLSVTGEAAVSSHLTVGGNLYVNGDLTNVNTTNLNVEDKFILLGSGSASPVDVGIIFGGVNTETRGAALFYVADGARLAYAAGGVESTDTAPTPSGYVPVAYDVTGASHTPEDKVGNIKIESGEAYIYV